MMPLLEGRIDRKTFIIGSGLGLGVLLAVIMVLIIPIALIDIVVNESHHTKLLKPVYYILLIPAAIYVFYFCVMAIRRAHDFGWPGVPLLFLLGILEVFSRLSGIWIPHLLVLAFLVLLCVLPSQKERNKFGPRPHKRFRFANLRL